MSLMDVRDHIADMMNELHHWHHATMKYAAPEVAEDDISMPQRMQWIHHSSEFLTVVSILLLQWTDVMWPLSSS